MPLFALITIIHINIKSPINPIATTLFGLTGSLLILILLFAIRMFILPYGLRLNEVGIHYTIHILTPPQTQHIPWSDIEKFKPIRLAKGRQGIGIKLKDVLNKTAEMPIWYRGYFKLNTKFQGFGLWIVTDFLDIDREVLLEDLDTMHQHYSSVL